MTEADGHLGLGGTRSWTALGSGLTGKAFVSDLVLACVEPRRATCWSVGPIRRWPERGLSLEEQHGWLLVVAHLSADPSEDLGVRMRSWNALSRAQRFKLGALVHTVFVLVASGITALAGSFRPGLGAGLVAAVVAAKVASSIAEPSDRSPPPPT
jgi:hypothetical protein